MVIETEISPYQALIQRLNDRTEPLSFSSFNKFCESPRHFMAYKLEKKEPTAAMAFGSMVHCLVLEEDAFDDRYIVMDIKSPSTAEAQNFCSKILAGYTNTEAFSLSGWKVPQETDKLLLAAEKKRAEYAHYIDINIDAKEHGLEICTEQDKKDAERLKEELYRNDATRWVLNQMTLTEKKIEWEFSGYNWRGFIDGEGDSLLLDLKSTNDANPKKVRRKILYDFHYDRQAALYTYGNASPHKDYYIVAFDKGGNTSVIRLDENDIRRAWEGIQWYMDRFRDCVALDAWNESYNFFGPDRGIYNLSDI